MALPTDPPITVLADEIVNLANQILANPPDEGTTATLGLADNGSLFAQWTNRGRRTSVGPTYTEPPPPESFSN